LSDSPLFAGSRRMVMSPHVRGVDREHPLDLPDRVVLDLHLVQDLVPGTVRGPQPQPLVRRLPWAVLGRHVAPRRPGAQPPQDRVDHLPVITPAPTTPGRDRQQRLDPRPRRVSQLTTPHTHNPDITGHMPRTFAGQGLGNSVVTIRSRGRSIKYSARRAVARGNRQAVTVPRAPRVHPPVTRRPGGRRPAATAPHDPLLDPVEGEPCHRSPSGPGGARRSAPPAARVPSRSSPARRSPWA